MSNDGKRKLSGYQYKRRRLEKESQRQKQASALKNYLQSTSASNTKIKEDANNASSNPVIKETPELSESESDDDKQIDDISDSTGTTPPPNESTIKIDTNLAPMGSDLQNLSTDPALWPRILGDAERSFLVKQGPPKSLYNYKLPSDDTGRKLSAHYYSRILSNGEQVAKDWLVYSISKNYIYCFCCKIFGGVINSLSKEGFKSWKHLVETLKGHESCKNHIQAQKTWLELSQRLMCCKSIDAAAQRIINSETNHWYEVLLRIVAITKMLSKRCLAFQGTSDKLFEYNNVNKSDSNEVEIKISESFLGFLPVERSTGKQMSEILIGELNHLGLNLQDIRGQGHDNGSNMRGDKSGVQSRIKNLNTRAFYVPCSCHSLNLVVGDMAKASLEATNFSNMVKKIYLFFLGIYFSVGNTS
ncbi:hypothetical protein CBL_05192 [Carabus blaptoides fortunei]